MDIYEVGKAESLAGWTEIGSATAQADFWPVTIRQTTEPERVKAKLSATEICDCFNLGKTSQPNEKECHFRP